MRPMFHFTERRIEAHVCICFIAYKVYKELERIIKLAGIKMSVGDVIKAARTITTIRVRLPENRRKFCRRRPLGLGVFVSFCRRRPLGDYVFKTFGCPGA